jgi:hypothetical protein
VTDAGLAHLSSHGELQELILQSTGVSDAGLVDLATCKSLRKLYLYKTKVTEEGMARLRKALPECDVTQIQIE